MTGDDTTTGPEGAGSPAGIALAAVTPAPTPEEVAAIMAAIEAVWPRPAAPTGPPPASRWRFSGRWWAKPVPLARERP